MMELGVIWLLGGILVAAVAKSKGRSGFGWFLISSICSPLLALIAVAAMRHFLVGRSTQRGAWSATTEDGAGFKLRPWSAWPSSAPGSCSASDRRAVDDARPAKTGAADAARPATDAAPPTAAEVDSR